MFKVNVLLSSVASILLMAGCCNCVYKVEVSNPVDVDRHPEMVEICAKDVADKKSAAARLESAKIELAEKRKVLDYAYNVALAKLKEYSEAEPQTFYAMLLEKYAEDGDVVYFAEEFDGVDAVAALPVFSTKKLTIASGRAKIAGGVLLVGKKADKDVSLTALIERDKELYLSQVASEIF